VLVDLYQSHVRDFRADEDAARALTEIGLAPVPSDVNVAELAAWTSVARAVLSLHETMTRS
jgi:hypothetical protein